MCTGPNQAPIIFGPIIPAPASAAVCAGLAPIISARAPVRLSSAPTNPGLGVDPGSTFSGYGEPQTIGLRLPSSLAPVSVTTVPGITVKQLVSDASHYCALLTDSSVRCWGANLEGSLGLNMGVGVVGDDELPSSVGPVSVTTAPGVTVAELSAGRSYTCAVLSDGTIACWGKNSSGQLGNGTTDDIGDDETPSSVGSFSVST